MTAIVHENPLMPEVPLAPGVRMATHPVDFFDGSVTKMQSLSLDKVKDLQLEALQFRFSELRNAIPTLQKLADRQGITKVDAFDDIVPLLFEHTVFKSYPTSLIDNKQFAQLTRWLDKLTSVDLSGVDATQCQGLDDWFKLLDEVTPLTVCHSSGTTGSLSLLPWSKKEWDTLGRLHVALMLQNFGDDTDSREHEGLEVIYPYYRSGSMSHMRNNDQVAMYIAKGEEHYHCAFRERMSSDVMYLAGRIKSAKAKGRLDSLKIDPDLLRRKEEFDALMGKSEERMAEFFAATIAKLAGKRIFLMSTWNIVYKMAMDGLGKGMSKVFSPDSILIAGGGAKGMVPPPDWKERAMEFVGVDRIGSGYSMSEVLLTAMQCENGHFHLNPWTIPFILDPDTSKPLPREGVQTGRAAFYDLTAETRWGGFISGDEVTLHWDADCGCGRKTTYYEGEIGRYSDKRGGDDKITCAATQDAHNEAMAYLNEIDGSAKLGL